MVDFDLMVDNIFVPIFDFDDVDFLNALTCSVYHTFYLKNMGFLITKIWFFIELVLIECQIDDENSFFYQFLFHQIIFVLKPIKKVQGKRNKKIR